MRDEIKRDLDGIPLIPKKILLDTKLHLLANKHAITNIAIDCCHYNHNVKRLYVYGYYFNSNIFHFIPLTKSYAYPDRGRWHSTPKSWLNTSGLVTMTIEDYIKQLEICEVMDII